MTGPASLLVTRLEAFAPDIVFNLAEGHRGKTRRAFYPALFEELGMPSTGSDAYTLCVTLDKALTKKQLAGLGRAESARALRDARVAAQRRARRAAVPGAREAELRGLEQGHRRRTASSRIRSRSGRVLDELLAKYPDGALVERYVPGTDVRVVVVEGVPALPPVETIVDPSYARRVDVFDYKLANVDTKLRRAPGAGTFAGRRAREAPRPRRANALRVRAARRGVARLPRRAPTARSGFSARPPSRASSRAARSSRPPRPSASTTTRP